jgi:hypothetical protein
VAETIRGKEKSTARLKDRIQYTGASLHVASGDNMRIGPVIVLIAGG